MLLLIHREQVRVTQARMEERILTSTLSKVDMAVVALDQQGRIAYASEGMSDLTGYSPSELVGMTPMDLMPAEFRDEHMEGFARALSGEVGDHLVRCQIQTKDGSVMSVDNHVYVYPGGGVAIIAPEGKADGKED